MNLGKVFKVMGIAGAALSGVTAVIEAIWPHGDELADRVSELENIVKEMKGAE